MRHAMRLLAIGDAPVILTPRTFLGVPEQIGLRNVMMMPNLGPAQAAEIFLSHIGAGFAVAANLLVIDAAHFEFGLERIP